MPQLVEAMNVNSISQITKQTRRWRWLTMGEVFGRSFLCLFQSWGNIFVRDLVTRSTTKIMLPVYIICHLTKVSFVLKYFWYESFVSENFCIIEGFEPYLLAHGSRKVLFSRLPAISERPNNFMTSLVEVHAALRVIEHGTRDKWESHFKDISEL